MNTYSTSTEIRNDAGFMYNTDVLDADIDTQRTRAYALINSYISARYSIPSLSDSNFTGSNGALLLQSIEILLGGGYLLIKEYGPEGRDTDKDGYRRTESAMEMLKEIQEGKLLLFGNDGAILPSALTANTSGTIRGYIPDTDPYFSTTDKF